MNILVITDNYPATYNPSRGVFLYSLVQEFIKNGHQATVVAPEFIQNIRFNRNSYGTENAYVFRPIALSLSSVRIFGWDSYMVGDFSFRKAIARGLKKINLLQVDLIYCHFLWNWIYSEPILGQLGKPVVVAVGENIMLAKIRSKYEVDRYQRAIDRVTGYIAVSETVKQVLISDHSIPCSKIIVAQNGVDLDKYKSLNRLDLRKKYNISKNDFVVIFVGRMVEAKGPIRVLNAVHKIGGCKLIFAGGGPQQPQGPNVIFSKAVPPNLVPELLTLSDIFVLPTLHEGSCNAIIEALAAGLPIVSSDLPEIREQIDATCSILIDPIDVAKISNAIILLRDNINIRQQMGLNSIRKSKYFDLHERSKKILKFLENILIEY